MISIAEEIKKIILSSPFLEQSIADGIINLSAFARKIKPGIEKNLLKTISESAVLMSLKRLIPNLPKSVFNPDLIKNHANDLTVRSNLIEFTFAKSGSIYENQKKLLYKIQDNQKDFITFTQGIYEVAVIANSHLKEDIKEIFKIEKIICLVEDLSAISIQLSPNNVSQPGVHYSILKQLAWYNINIIDVVSTFTEFIIILKKEDIDTSFSILMKYLSSN